MPRGAPATRSYFERHRHEYDPRRLRRALNWIERLPADDPSIFEVGCGDGGVLVVLSEAGFRNLAACDLAETALHRARDRVEFDGHRGSILDAGFVASLPDRYDVVVMAAVLHHLVGGSRRSSRRLADRGLRHALSLLAPGGHLVVVEPTYGPPWAMTLVFWVKRIVGVVGRRIELGKWNNLGAPLVSYYDPAALQELIGGAGGELIRNHDKPQRLRRLPRVLGIRGRWSSTILVRRAQI
jgi:SAM-dependent methyltransferase